MIDHPILMTWHTTWFPTFEISTSSYPPAHTTGLSEVLPAARRAWSGDRAVPEGTAVWLQTVSQKPFFVFADRSELIFIDTTSDREGTIILMCQGSARNPEIAAISFCES
jgi:hypothetical protein